MGLDMYLEAEAYVSGHEFSPEHERAAYQGVIEALGAQEISDPEKPSATVSVAVAYWRKANAIHKWFVDNVQDGEDECRPHEVSRDQLAELMELCRRVLGSTDLAPGHVHTSTVYSDEHPQGAVVMGPGRIVRDPAVAHALLPTQEGFFFGGTDYDEWYWRGLEDTVRQIERALKAPERWTFKYQSSW